MEIRLIDVTMLADGQSLLNEISCTIEEGATTIVVGAGGSGKTLLLKVIAGIVPPTYGDVLFDNRSLDTMAAAALRAHRMRQGFVFQDAALWQNLTVYQNIALPLQYHYPRMTAAEIDRRIRSLCRAMDFTEDLAQRPVRLSAGEQKVASFLRGIILDPETIFMDEPSSALDSRSREQMLGVLRDCKERGRTMIIATHDGQLASMIADRIIVIDAGQLIAHDTVAALTRTATGRVRDLLSSILNLASTYDTDILDILGSGDVDPFS